jgi:hypothetical protein
MGASNSTPTAAVTPQPAPAPVQRRHTHYKQRTQRGPLDHFSTADEQAMQRQAMRTACGLPEHSRWMDPAMRTPLPEVSPAVLVGDRIKYSKELLHRHRPNNAGEIRPEPKRDFFNDYPSCQLVNARALENQRSERWMVNNLDLPQSARQTLTYMPIKC